jgi:tRNA threonylcarbamoyladenosine biosynthesis protein TsaB
MIVLAVDTTTTFESVAVVRGQALLGEVRLPNTDTHSRRVMTAVEFLLAEVGLGPAQLDGFAVTAGPGSFTGLRVGLSTVQGLALASRRPCYAACTLDVLARRIEGAAPQRVALMDAFRSEVYAARYDAQHQRVDGPLLSAPEPWLRALPPGCAFIGDAVAQQRPLIEAVCVAPLFPGRSLFLAATLGLLAARALAAGEGVSAAELRPLYLRAPTVRGAGA